MEETRLVERLLSVELFYCWNRDNNSCGGKLLQYLEWMSVRLLSVEGGFREVVINGIVQIDLINFSQGKGNK